MAQINIELQPFSAISFDLDDTLYNNSPIIAKAEQMLLKHLASKHPKIAHFDFHQWLTLKRKLTQQFPELLHDTTAARLVTLEQGFLSVGYNTQEAKESAGYMMNFFATHRSNFKIDSDTLALLDRLKQHYRLIGITNGNVDIKQVGLETLFEFVLSPGDGIKMKPSSDMFDLACQRLNISPSQLLHVGDSPTSDVEGARLAGCQAIWLNPPFGQTLTQKSPAILPHIELSSLEQLAMLLPS